MRERCLQDAWHLWRTLFLQSRKARLVRCIDTMARSLSVTTGPLQMSIRSAAPRALVLANTAADSHVLSKNRVTWQHKATEPSRVHEAVECSTWCHEPSQLLHGVVIACSARASCVHPRRHPTQAQLVSVRVKSGTTQAHNVAHFGGPCRLDCS